MTNIYNKVWGFRLITLFILLLSLGRMVAQDVTIDLTVTGPRTEQGVTLQYHWYEDGANIYGDHNADWGLDIKAPKKMVRIEFDGKKNGVVVTADDNGTLVFDRLGTSVWTGSSDHVNFIGGNSNTDYYISHLYIWYENSNFLCAPPTISLENGLLSITSSTADATCYGSLMPVSEDGGTVTGSTLPLQGFTLTAYAESPTCRRSGTVAEDVTLDHLFSLQMPDAPRSDVRRKADEERTFQRNKVLVEKHTGLKCSYCPSGDAAFNDFMARHPEHEGHVIEMRHNSYPSYDVMYVPGLHNSLSSRWGVSGWPCYIVERCDPDGNHYSNGAGYHVGSWQYWKYTNYDPITPRYNKPTNVSLSLDGSSYDPATRLLTVHLSGEVTKDLPDLCVNIYVAQNKISGYDGDAYQHVTRDYLTENVHGDALTVIDGHYDVTFTTTLENKYAQVAADPDNMEVIAFISTFNAEDFTHSEVHNADCIALADLPAVALPRCESPEISLQDGVLTFASEQDGATFSYAFSSPFVALTDAADPYSALSFCVTATAHVEDYAASAPTSRTYTLRELLANRTLTNAPHHTLSVGETSAPVYDLQGRKSHNPLKGGLYIQNGRKMLIK